MKRVTCQHSAHLGKLGAALRLGSSNSERSYPATQDQIRVAFKIRRIVLPSEKGVGQRSSCPCGTENVQSRLVVEMLVEKLGNLAERDGGLGQAIVELVLRVGLAFIDLELCLYTGRAERTMHSHRVA